MPLTSHLPLGQSFHRRPFNDTPFNPLYPDSGHLAEHLNTEQARAGFAAQKRARARDRILRRPSYGHHGLDGPSSDTGFGAGEPYHRAIELAPAHRPQRS